MCQVIRDFIKFNFTSTGVQDLSCAALLLDKYCIPVVTQKRFLLHKNLATSCWNAHPVCNPVRNILLKRRYIAFALSKKRNRRKTEEGGAGGGLLIFDIADK